MTRLFKLPFLLLLCLCMPLNVIADEELHAIKEKAPISKLYERTLQFFTEKIPEAFEKKLSNSSKYIDLITEIFEEKNIPVDIAYLPLIESGFSPLSVGRGDTVGLWQFVKGTARKYGLKIDKYVDERKDPVKSTYAAANYLRDLYSMFGAWDIALAAYNAGEGKIKRIMSRSERLPGMANRYLAKFMAASTVAQDPESYGLELNEDTKKEDMNYIEIITNRVMSLKAIAETYNTTALAIKKLNPALRTDKTPPYEYIIRLPN